MNSPSPLQGWNHLQLYIMPNQNLNKRRVTKNSKRAALPQSEGKTRMAVPQIRGAPAGVSQDRQQFTEFAAGNTRGSLVMRTCAAISQIQRISTTAQGNGLADNTAAYVSVQLNLTDAAGLTGAGTKTGFAFLSPVFDLIASAFVRYRIRKLIFHYEPQSSSSSTERLVFAFANDPVHPVLWNATPPTQAALLALSDSRAFSPWAPWSMDVSNKISKDELYCYSEPSTTVSSFVERFSDFGVISCVTSSVSGSNTPCGVLYMESEIELIEFCPISVTRPSALTKICDKANNHLAKRPSTKWGAPQPVKEAESMVCQEHSTTTESQSCVCHR
jgi:hypothetical protein